MKSRLLLIILPLLVLPIAVLAQEEEQRFMVDTPVSLDFEIGDEPITPKKKKRKKKTFYGIKTKKGFTRKGVGERIVYEKFYYLKKAEKPQTFVRDLYWYDFKRREIRKTTLAAFKPTDGVLLHGPYEKRLGTNIIETGIFYKGTRHGRWVTYDRDSVLTDKQKYIRGWPKESTISYYDPQTRKKMKELTPIEFGDREGYYFFFHENGQVAVQGEFKWDQRVGDWTEFYTTGKRKKIITYPKKAFDKQVKPFIKAEWNDKGKEIYRNSKMTN